MGRTDGVNVNTVIYEKDMIKSQAEELLKGNSTINVEAAKTTFKAGITRLTAIDENDVNVNIKSTAKMRKTL